MQKIVPHLWFDTQAVEAAEFYLSVFPDASMKKKTVLKNTPSGDTAIVSFELMGYSFMAINAGPYFKINPSISFHVKCATEEEVDAFWEKLLPGGKVMMELGAYPFSKRYGWVEDKFGVSWQIIHADQPFQQRIVPSCLFTKDACGKAEEAINFYASVFHDAKIESISRYEEGESPVDKPGTIKYAQVMLENQEFTFMESAFNHEFSFSEAISFVIHCKDQDEIDYYWEKLSAVPEAEQCGWVKDKFGISWQVVPMIMDQMMSEGSQEQIDRVTQAFLKMKKFDLKELEAAYSNEA